MPRQGSEPDTDQQSISQDTILGQIQTHLLDSKTGADVLYELKNGSACCHGFGMLAAFGLWLQLTTHPDARTLGMIDSYFWFEKTLRQIAGWQVSENKTSQSTLSEEMRLFELVWFCQHSMMLGYLQCHIAEILTLLSGMRFTTEYSLTVAGTVSELLEPFSLRDDQDKRTIMDIVCPADKMIFICSEFHTTSLIYHHKRYFYYDANDHDGVQIFYTQRALLNHIFSTHFVDGLVGKLAFVVIDLKSRAKLYPDAGLVLSQFYQGKILTDYQLGALLLLSAQLNCFESAKIYLIKNHVRQLSCDFMDSQGITPLFFFVVNNHLLMSMILYDYGANINHTNHDGVSCLHAACMLNRVDVVKFLLENGADQAAFSKAGSSALDFALRGEAQEVIKYLISNSVFALSDRGRVLLKKWVAENIEYEKSFFLRLGSTGLWKLISKILYGDNMSYTRSDSSASSLSSMSGQQGVSAQVMLLLLAQVATEYYVPFAGEAPLAVVSGSGVKATKYPDAHRLFKAQHPKQQKQFRHYTLPGKHHAPSHR